MLGWVIAAVIVSTILSFLVARKIKHTCTECGQQSTTDFKFCGKCGAKRSSESNFMKYSKISAPFLIIILPFIVFNIGGERIQYKDIEAKIIKASTIQGEHITYEYGWFIEPEARKEIDLLEDDEEILISFYLRELGSKKLKGNNLQFFSQEQYDALINDGYETQLFESKEGAYLVQSSITSLKNPVHIVYNIESGLLQQIGHKGMWTEHPVKYNHIPIRYDEENHVLQAMFIDYGDDLPLKDLTIRFVQYNKDDEKSVYGFIYGGYTWGIYNEEDTIYEKFVNGELNLPFYPYPITTQAKDVWKMDSKIQYAMDIDDVEKILNEQGREYIKLYAPFDSANTYISTYDGVTYHFTDMDGPEGSDIIAYIGLSHITVEGSNLDYFSYDFKDTSPSRRKF